MGKIYVTGKLLFKGKPYTRGDEFDWEKAGCSPRQLEVLMRRRKLSSHKPKEVEPQRQLPTDPPPGKRPPQIAMGATDTGTDSTDTGTDSTDTGTDSTDTGTDSTDTVDATLVHTGHGWYNVEVEGLGAVNESKIRGEDEAKEWAKEQGYQIK